MSWLSGLFKTSKVSTPDTSLQQAEAERQAALERELAQQQLAQQQSIYDQQRADDERRYQEQSSFQQQEAARQRAAFEAEINRQIAAQQAAEAKAEAEREAVRQQQAKRATDARAYSVGRQGLIDQSTNEVDKAYAGFDAPFFDSFAKSFVDAYAPDIQRSFDQEGRDRTFKFADTGNLRSSAAARSFGDLERGRATEQGKLASQAKDTAGSFATDIANQKSDALSLLFSSGAVGSDNLPDGATDVSGELGGIASRLGALTQTQANKAKSIKAPSFSAGLNVNPAAYGKKPAYSVS